MSRFRVPSTFWYEFYVSSLPLKKRQLKINCTDLNPSTRKGTVTERKSIDSISSQFRNGGILSRLFLLNRQASISSPDFSHVIIRGDGDLHKKVGKDYPTHKIALTWLIKRFVKSTKRICQRFTDRLTTYPTRRKKQN